MVDFTRLATDELETAREYLRASDRAIRPTALRTIELAAAGDIAAWPVGLNLADHSLAGRQRVINHLSRMVRSNAFTSTACRAALARSWKTEQFELSQLWVRTPAAQPCWTHQLRDALAPCQVEVAA